MSGERTGGHPDSWYAGERSTAYGWTASWGRPTAWGPTTLMARITGVESNQAKAIGHYHPHGTADTPMENHLTRTTVSGSRAQVETAAPLYVGFGTSAAPLPATSRGRWAQLYAAGRP